MHAANTALGKGALYINAYPLQHNKAVYEGWRKVGPNNKRVYILTRSAFAGLQRYAAACWSGDINANQSVYTAQIPAGLSFAISGMPYWTTDIGGYFGQRGRDTSARSCSPAGFSSAPSTRCSASTAGAQGAVRLADGARRARPTCSPSTICAIA